MSKERLVVAMSGGVDSSVAAAFLAHKGYQVIGMTMRITDEENRCCSDQDLQDARTVADLLGIPHYTVSFKNAFKTHVIDYFIDEYVKGRTPNPCAICNPKIKFGMLYQKATKLGAKYLATGHYAAVSLNRGKNRYFLKQGKERGKDQSYFLARLSQETLSRVLFPVGNFPKIKIRNLAERFNLPIAQKHESQEVCFISGESISEFIEKTRGQSAPSGPIVDKTGIRLGKHQGITGYTIGQRKGLGIAMGKPVYVTQIHANTNTLVIGEEKDLYHQTLLTSDPNWILIEDLQKPMRVRVKIRYKHHASWATISPQENNHILVQFDVPQRGITPGQLAVFYDRHYVVGSAWIESILDKVESSSNRTG